MDHGDEDDKPTVVLDLNALKKQKLKQEEDLANIGLELEFNVDADAGEPAKSPAVRKPPTKLEEEFGEDKLPPKQRPTQEQKKPQFPVILFDLQSDFFKKTQGSFPKGFNYKIMTSLADLNVQLRTKDFQLAVFNYDVNPKAVNQLCAQIKQKFPNTKTMIMAKSISPEKAKLHAKTPSGASGYYQFPLEAEKIEKEFVKIQTEKKIG